MREPSMPPRAARKTATGPAGHKNGAAAGTRKSATSAAASEMSPKKDAEAGDDAGKDSYFGGKGSSFRNLVNQIPPHDWLIVPFAGHCAIVRNMQLPARVWINDIDVDVFRWWSRQLEAESPKPASEYSDRIEKVSMSCGIDLLESPNLATVDREQTFIYCDPPYQLETRKSGPRYRHEMSTEDHVRMLHAACSLQCRVMISGYASDLYTNWLSGWRHYTFQAATRRGMATEHVWCNYPEPATLQDYRWLGRDKRHRYNLLRRERNLIAKLKRLSEIERNALLAAVDAHFGGDGSGVEDSEG